MTDSHLRVLCAGAGHMGRSHALAYQKIPGFEVAGIVTRTKASRSTLNGELGGTIPEFADFHEALAAVKPDAVSISTYPETHFEYAAAALKAGCHVFLEKPIAETVEGAVELLELARKANRKLIAGYILRHHPGWIKFIEVARTLGRPLVMRMNLNQQSSGANWITHKNLIASVPPIVDCGVHYVDVMCQMTSAKPVRVSGIGARLTDEIPEGAVNYGALQVTFEDGSVGWYEAGWGPMMSETAYFIKDVIGPRGSVSIAAGYAADEGHSADVDAHTSSPVLRLHHATLDASGQFAKADEMIRLDHEPDHDGLCRREQEYFLTAIREDLDLSEHHASILNSMRIVAAADESFRTGKMVEL